MAQTASIGDSPRHRSLAGLTGLRAIAALWVIAFHYRIGPFGPLDAKSILPILGYGYLGVDLFFMLSGFVLWHVHARDMAQPSWRGTARFVALRAARLMPVYLFTLALLVLIYWAEPRFGGAALNPANYRLRALVLQAFMVQSWGLTDRLSWNYPDWSVSAEWFCYLFFPGAVLVMTRFRLRATAAALAMLALAIGVEYLIAFNRHLNQSIGAVTLLRAAPEFLLGCMLRQMSWQTPMQRWPWPALLGLAVATWAVSFYSFLPEQLFALPLFALLILAAATAGSVADRVLAWAPLVAIGEASYSLYLMQAPVQRGARALKTLLSPSHPLRSAAVAAGYLVLLGIGTALVHGLVENPARRWLRARIARVFGDRRVPAEPAAQHAHAAHDAAGSGGAPGWPARPAASPSLLPGRRFLRRDR